MNALFRRDYLYQFNKSSLNGISKGTLIRYINFDRKTKEYVFVEGNYKTTGELKLRISETQGNLMYSRLKQLHRIGYENTDQYLKTPKGTKVLPSVPKILQEKPRVFTNINDMTVGKTYLIVECSHYISKKPLTLLSRPVFSKVTATFNIKDSNDLQDLYDNSRFKAIEVN